MNNLTKNVKVKLQSFGAGLATMIMPIIGVFIAWGLLTSFFIPSGWLPNEELATMVGIGITYVIPIIIAYLGGYRIYKLRGGVIGVLVSMAVIAAGQSETFVSITGGKAPMLLAVMIFGPLTAAILKYTEKLWINKIPTGFEMLINNFYLGILGFLLLFPIYYLSAYGVGYLIKLLGIMTYGMRDLKLYPILAIVVEPAKILFLNNAINHGVFSTLGVQEVEATGKSILFLLESNPGPGLGLLLAFILFSKDKNQKAQAGSSSLIHLFGGIHEVYFPFALLKPILIVALISGGAFGNAMFQLFDVGAVAPVSPGSIIAQYLQVEKTTMSVIGLTVGIFDSTLVTLGMSWLLMMLSKTKFFKSKKEMTLEQAQKLTQMKKMESKGIKKVSYEQIVFACDAGMGSSAMGAGILKKMLRNENFQNVVVTNKAISNLDGSEEIIVTIDSLEQRVKSKNPNAKIIVLKQFLDKEKYQEILQDIKNEQN